MITILTTNNWPKLAFAGAGVNVSAACCGDDKFPKSEEDILSLRTPFVAASMSSVKTQLPNKRTNSVLTIVIVYRVWELLLKDNLILAELN